MAITNATNETFSSAIADGVSVVDFWAPWCGPCKMIAPVLEALAEDLPAVHVVKVNVDDEGSLAAHYGVMSIPTLLIVKNGEVVDQLVGYQPKEALIERIHAHQ